MAINFKDLLETAFPLLKAGGQQLLDVLVNGKLLKENGIKGYKMAYCALKIFGEDWVNDTETAWDNEGVEFALTHFADTLTEAGVAIPII